MASRGISVKQRAWLVGQLDDWQLQQIVSTDQASRILALYETPAQLAERGRTLLLTALMGVAAVMVGLAALLMIGYNWEAMPKAVKLLVIFGVLLSTQIAGFVLRYRRQARLLSEVTFLLGGLFYGAAIFLISQIFHLSGHSPDAVWWWAVGVLPFAFCLESVLLHALLVVLLAMWCSMEVLGYPELGGWLWQRWKFMPNGAYSLIVLALPGLAWANRRNSLVTVWLYVLLLSWWAVIQPFAWRLPELSLVFAGAVAGLMLLAAAGHRPESRLAAPYQHLGVLILGGVLFLLSFYQVWEGMFDYYKDRLQYANGWGPLPIYGPASGWILLAAAMIAGIGMLYVASTVECEPSTPDAPLDVRVRKTIRRHWLAVGMFSLMLVLLILWLINAGPLPPTILANAAMFVLGLWLLGAGLQKDAGRIFAAGVVYLLLWAVSRYIDLFGDFGGMLGAAGMFLVCGLALFGVAWFWRHRKKVRHAT
jgi:uncharacterized membrane protein